MLRCLNTSGNLSGSCSDMTVLDRQRARMIWQQDHHHEHQQHQHQHQHQGCFSSASGVFSSSLQVHDDSGSSLADVVARSIKPDPMANGWPKLDKVVMGFGSSGLPPLPVPPPATAPAAPSGFDANSAISRTSSCPPVLEEEAKGKESFKKRKADKAPNTKVVAENDDKDKRIKVGAEDGESKITGQTSTKNNSATTNNKNNTDTTICADTTSKENSKASEVQKPDYIHVRARRGQATDSHSLAERVRREKISERMKYLQDLVPGCNKITGKAGMLDEIINYVQSLQRQVEFLSMKLAAVNPRLDFNIDDLFAKEVFPGYATASFPAIGISPEMANPAPYLQFNPPQQIVPACGLDAAGINPPDMGLRRTISAPVSLPETFVDSPCFTQILPSSTWEGDFQNLYNVAFDQARAPSFPSQLFTGLIEPSNLKMEM